MCGISGIYLHNKNYNTQKINFNTLNTFLKHRGPDNSNNWKNNEQNLFFFHNRLSIVDLDKRSNQPLIYENKYSIIFNGEIYNFEYLKDNLVQDGYKFKTHSDTELIAALYDKYRDDSFKMLEGIFAIAIYDIHNNNLVLTRDVFGVKPLYYYKNEDLLVFASEVKIFNEIFYKKNFDFEPAAYIGFSLLGYVPEPFTILKDVYALEPGQLINIDGSAKIEFKKLESLRDIALEIEDKNSSINDLADIRDEINKSVKLNLMGDVDKSIFLSSGFDSKYISYCANKTFNQKTIGLSLGFKENSFIKFDETKEAKKFSNKFGLDFNKKIIDYEEFQYIEKFFFSSMDQPTSDGFNTFLVSLFAKEKGLKVCLSGLGGDELLFSYPLFRSLNNFNKFKFLSNFDFISNQFNKIISKNENSKIKKLLNIPKYIDSHVKYYFLLRSYLLPYELNKIFDEKTIEEGFNKLDLFKRLSGSIDGIKNNFIKTSLLELNWYTRNQLLKDSDVFGMKNSVEIRVPFLTKNLLKKTYMFAMNKKMNLKHELINNNFIKFDIPKKKLGFGYPLRTWLSKKFNKDFYSNIEYQKVILGKYGYILK